MSAGFANALSEITLVLFTTLAPSGAVAFFLMSIPLIRGGLDRETHVRIDKALAIPLVASLAGLVASATHLGNPANALYVLTGVGRSPLSNEVVCAVTFLTFAGVYWLYSFALNPRRGLQRALTVCSCISAIAFVTAVAFAYSAHTIISWDTVFSPLTLWLNALSGGPLLAIVGLRVARWKSAGNRYEQVMLVFSLGALIACLVAYVLQGAALKSIENSWTTAAQLVPGYAGAVIAFALLAACGIALDAPTLFKRSKTPAPHKETTISILRASIACSLALAGIFVMRFTFYMMHMTTGISF